MFLEGERPPLSLTATYNSAVKKQRHLIVYKPVDTGRKLNLHKTFRRRPRRLPNVLCTFNLRPVSTRRSGE